MAGNPPVLPPVDGTDTGFNPNFDSPSSNGNALAEGLGSASAEPMQSTCTQPPEALQNGPDPKVQEEVQRVLYSDIGVGTLLNRLKASIASARDFSTFLKRRGATEEEHASTLRKLTRSTMENIQKPDARHESYQRQFQMAVHANERIADNGTQYGLALHAMHENLLQLATKMDSSRKTWKQQGLAAEKKVHDAEALAEKAKAKYDQLAEDLDRVKTGDTGAGRKFGIKGPKSAAQHEEDLGRKLQAADQDYASKVQTAQAYRKELVATTRPQAVSALLDLIKEMDAALTMEMQKYASFTEKLAVNNGQVVSPQSRDGTAPPTPSINKMIYEINNDRDFEEYISKHASKVPAVRTEVQYVKHPTLAPSQGQQKPLPVASNDRRTSMLMQGSQPSSFPQPQPQPQPQPEAPQSPQQFMPPQQPEPIQQPSYQTYGTPYQEQPLPDQQQPPYPNQPPSFSNASRYSQAAQPPPPQSEYPRGPAGQVAAQQSSGVTYSSSAPPVNPVFGVSLDELFRRDGSPVPLVVYQCIQAIDLFGLEIEGIYRIPGTSSHIQSLKTMFDTDTSQVDFRNPEAFQHDVNSVAGLLKQFFRELPDPLLTREFYNKFIDAARVEDDTTRRDSMHALINGLPDPNYATLRALMLHLHRVQQNAEVNRMSTANLGICWAPSVMGPHKGNNMADAGLQARVVITILDNVLQIFDED
ncbi:RhoGAP-domain-containing protein [Sporormia fimetaria CBS 119925]|uniref:RhoGAP-domain-containing protein n=1 Tax=Sporormia fimetaria CBS 119925 TaxID=1340428 RepID=A0A6A6VN37_9PLEO|nr:RhoGAP-domain-containing protein [Sporormia fimetaria CBS 119925]